ncbi:phosphoglycerate mutase [Thermomonas brevis]|uniref:Phosphoglycerate mutase n=1 Tax=Thermomonas brevis TaxID=215691 RepID=A0A7G9QTI0_9GAMM|nr:phosphoglycerate mutase [Thermomonas brevis]QNN46655.1 phosphoglycerate mutase [Thermomonas brevis]
MSLTLLLPSASRFAGVALPPVLAKALGCADRMRADAGEHALLTRHFDLLPRGWPAAALTRLLDAGEDDARHGAWLRADPAHIRPDINGARLLGIGANLGMEQADVDALLPALRPLFGDAGFQLEAPHPSRWYLRLPREAKLPAFASPDEALGDDVFDHLPNGNEARRWRALESEVQITLHNHPHNAARLAAGKVPVNALWFWGGGVLPDAMSSAAPAVYSDDPAVLGVVRLGGLQGRPLSAFQQGAGDALVDLRGQRDARALVERWLLPAAADAGKRATTFDFADGLAFALRPNQRWRFWRKPLSDLPA